MAVVVSAGFLEAMERLAPKERTACTEFVLKFLENQAHPGISLERLGGKYVAMTRARDLLRVTWTGRPSPFLVPVLPAIGGAP